MQTKFHRTLHVHALVWACLASAAGAQTQPQAFLTDLPGPAFNTEWVLNWPTSLSKNGEFAIVRAGDDTYHYIDLRVGGPTVQTPLSQGAVVVDDGRALGGTTSPSGFSSWTPAGGIVLLEAFNAARGGRAANQAGDVAITSRGFTKYQYWTPAGRFIPPALPSSILSTLSVPRLVDLSQGARPDPALVFVDGFAAGIVSGSGVVRGFTYSPTAGYSGLPLAPIPAGTGFLYAPDQQGPSTATEFDSHWSGGIDAFGSWLVGTAFTSDSSGTRQREPNSSTSVLGLTRGGSSLAFRIPMNSDGTPAGALEVLPPMHDPLAVLYFVQTAYPDGHPWYEEVIGDAYCSAEGWCTSGDGSLIGGRVKKLVERNWYRELDGSTGQYTYWSFGVSYIEPEETYLPPGEIIPVTYTPPRDADYTAAIFDTDIWSWRLASEYLATEWGIGFPSSHRLVNVTHISSSGQTMMGTAYSSTDRELVTWIASMGETGGVVPCPGDVDEDGDVDIDDIVAIANGIGTSGPDLNGDGTTTWEDVELALVNYGPCGAPMPLDTDGDGLPDAYEIDAGLDPYSADTDGDGLEDEGELEVYGTDPAVADTDGDGLSDGDEVAMAFGGCPDPLDPDSDGDGLVDGYDAAVASACDMDADLDGLTDADELTAGTDPLDPDTDNDGLCDGTEVDLAAGTGCPSALLADSDGDTLSDADELALGYDPCNADTDGDGATDDVDPTPAEPGVSSGFIEDHLRVEHDLTLSIPLTSFDAPNTNAAEGRRGALANMLTAAANKVAEGDLEGALDKLQSVLERLDGVSPPPDWMEAGSDRDDLVASVETAIGWIELELGS